MVDDDDDGVPEAPLRPTVVGTEQALSTRVAVAAAVAAREVALGGDDTQRDDYAPPDVDDADIRGFLRDEEEERARGAFDFGDERAQTGYARSVEEDMATVQHLTHAMSLAGVAENSMMAHDDFEGAVGGRRRTD